MAELEAQDKCTICKIWQWILVNNEKHSNYLALEHKKLVLMPNLCSQKDSGECYSYELTWGRKEGERCSSGESESNEKVGFLACLMTFCAYPWWESK